MNKTEEKVLETLKNGFGLTSAEQEILANYIDKLQKENEELRSKCNSFYGKSATDFIIKDKIKAKIKELDEKNKMFKLELPEDVTIYQYGIEVLKELLGE